MAAVTAPPAPFVPERYHHQPGYAMFVAGFRAGKRVSRSTQS
jgi:hypothetical protein